MRTKLGTGRVKRDEECTCAANESTIIEDYDHRMIIRSKISFKVLVSAVSVKTVLINRKGAFFSPPSVLV